MNDETLQEFFPEWVTAAQVDPAGLDTLGVELTGHAQVIADGLKMLIRVVSEWVQTNDTGAVPWQYESSTGRDINATTLIVALDMTHAAERHRFYMQANWTTGTTHAFKSESDNFLAVETTPKRVGAA